MIQKTMMAAAAFMMLIFAQPAHAEGTAKEFIALLDTGGATGESATIFLVGVSIGIGWADTELADRGQSRLVCEPEKLGLTPDQTVDIFRRFLAENKDLDDLPAGLIMLNALIETFPCK
ncbi:Rap1a/Tai family immunity protein [Tsuneonella sp. SYSU-LHT278]|uniref:Rap1a/Tai family immunity protein n=1 Tax=Tsuneonella sediminis TaxID=3416089 RepID=UPI003F79440B